MNLDEIQHNGSSMVLTLNVGSSSLKFSVYQESDMHGPVLSGQVEGIHSHTPILNVREPGHHYEPEHLRQSAIPQILAKLENLLERKSLWKKITRIGHRIVHGGFFYSDPCLITHEVLRDLETIIPLAKDHLERELEVVKFFQSEYPNLPQYACFDTCFHRSIPEVAKVYPFPKEIREQGVRKFGFHGLSCESICEQMRTIFPDVAHKRMLISHLGNGASITAVQDGKSLENTMGLSPCGGLVMGTRSGDLDPVVITYLAEFLKMEPQFLYRLVTHESGLKGISGITSDLRYLLEIESENSDAKLAVDVFCHSAIKQIAALIAVLRGCDALIFTGGIGENSSIIRERICRGLGFLGISINRSANSGHSIEISNHLSPIRVFVLPANEEEVIAKTTFKMKGAHEYENEIRSIAKNKSLLAGGQLSGSDPTLPSKQPTAE